MKIKKRLFGRQTTPINQHDQYIIKLKFSQLLEELEGIKDAVRNKQF